MVMSSPETLHTISKQVQDMQMLIWSWYFSILNASAKDTMSNAILAYIGYLTYEKSLVHNFRCLIRLTLGSVMVMTSCLAGLSLGQLIHLLSAVANAEALFLCV